METENHRHLDRRYKMRYELTAELLTGNALIDSEHRQLFAAINNLMEECEKGRGRDFIAQTSKFLLDYVAKHFSDEEKLQVSSKYPGYPAHKTFHEGYKKNLAQTVKEIETNGATIASLGKLNSVVAVLISHIRREDKNLAAHVKKTHG